MLLAAGVGFARALLIVLSRWGHILAGITWIGLLYFFNFVQVPAYAEFEAGARTEAIRKLTSRALWWFRWAAALTFATGLLIFVFQQDYKSDYMKSLPWLSIFTGMLYGTIMFANVWLVIWPNQKIVIANAEGLAAGREADPNAAAAGRKALLASRTNTLFSIPMVFFMAATSHFFAVAPHLDYLPGAGKRVAWYLIALVVAAVIELNALGYIGGTGPGPTKKPLEKHPDTIVAGFVVWVALFVVMLLMFYKS
ncbi:MAG: hypothetical protein JWO37_3448 [Acidimicrobiales bacterium]|jgi:uncharacterized membrane protein|nr:hypothetical protein [Acidimicrobiales bacterium]